MSRRIFDDNGNEINAHGEQYNKDISSNNQKKVTIEVDEALMNTLKSLRNEQCQPLKFNWEEQKSAEEKRIDELQKKLDRELEQLRDGYFRKWLK